jgi:hypothetical protein
MRYGFIPLLLTIGACSAMPPPPPQPSLTLPETASWRGAGDPTRGAILASAHVFAQPSSIAGNPAAAAEALGQLEFLAVELAVGGRWQGGFDPLVAPMLGQGRAQARAAMGVRPDASPQGAVDAWYAAAAALRTGDRARAEAALALVAAAPSETLRRLDPLPALPAAAIATSRAQGALMARDSDSRRRPLF